VTSAPALKYAEAPSSVCALLRASQYSPAAAAQTTAAAPHPA